MYILKNWSLQGMQDDGYTAPEFRKPYLVGEIYGHPRFKDGATVSTSYIVSTTGRLVSTVSGSVYSLEEPRAEYLEWMKENGYTLDEEWPVKLLKPTSVMN